MNEVALQPRRINLVNAALFTDLSLIALLWCVSILVVNPVGDFPIIDDELYGRVVRSLLETGQYRHPDANMPFITNLAWGALFSLPAGVSFTALRLSTLVAGLFGLFGAYILIRDLGQPRWMRWVVTLTLAFNPAYFALSYTFMTDVLFAALCIWAAVFFARSLKSGSDFELVLGTLLALAATLSRQIGVVIPFAFAGALILRRGATWQTLLRAASPLGVCLLAFIGFYHALAASGHLPPLYSLFNNVAVSTFTHSRTLLTTPLMNGYSTVIYLGLFLLPVLLCTTRYVARPGSKGVFAIAAAAIAILVLGAVIRTRFGWSNFMPLPEGHLLRESGIGLLWLRGADHVPALPESFWVCVTALAFIGVALLIFKLSAWVLGVARSLLNRNPMSETAIVTLFLLSAGIILPLPFIGIRSTDRYLIPCLTFFAAGIVSLPATLSGATSGFSKPLRYATFALLGAFGIFSVVGTRDYLAWHRVSSEASRDLMATSHVPAQSIDGGTEFNFLHPAQASPKEILDAVKKLERKRPQYFFTDELRKQYGLLIGLGWRPSSAEYVVAFGPVKGYGVIREYAYDNWMPPRVQNIVVLQKQ